ncbi:structural maintenance of chromosomes protein 5-like [Eriocheir sinensis]|uniref:structural maintenance of chromosomes protein 5-like n=1 Tax=Eriocheir sinensis TaxID=95602 RepID=UPI0021C87B8E|nr:structural maintenance of chromosomes protein 5-like [Eriocheir sinensis]
MPSKDLNFKTGNICRIYIKDFLTFDEVEIRPKPRLNFIYGPNGAGKSSILCAICICLGGKPSVTGRGREEYNFVKRDKTEAEVEVEIHMEGEINMVIKRKINSKLKRCTWYLQGKEVNASTVLKKIESLNIQVDNLCQFLPQDRVVEFAKLNKTNLLLATQKAVGDSSLHQQHQILSESGQKLKEFERNQEDLKNRLADSEKKNARLKKVVDNMEVKEKLQEELKILRTKRLWYLYDHKRKIHQQHRDELKEKERELKELHKALDPVAMDITTKKAALHRYKKTIKEKNEFLRKSLAAAVRTQQDYEHQGELLQEAKRTYQAKEAEQQQWQTEVDDYRRQLDMLLGQLQNLPQINEAELTQRLRVLTNKIHLSSQGIVSLQGRVSNTGAEREEKVRRIKAYTKELEAKEDIMGQRMELLKNRNPDVYRAAKWVEKNREMFKGRVHPPLFSLLDISAPEYARYIENRVQHRDLVAFVCEDKEDVNRLKAEMDALRLRVNIIYSNPHDLGNYRPSIPIESLHKYGFITYMLDVVSAPPAILSFLCRSYSMHNVPIALDKNTSYNEVPNQISVFYMGNSRYSSTRSRYDGVVSLSIYPLRETQLLRITQDKERISFLQNSIAELKEKIKEQEEDIRGLRAQEEELSKRLEEWRNEKRALSSRKEERSALAKRIEQKRSQIARHGKDAIDLKAEQRKMEETCVECFNKQVKLTMQHKVSMTNSARGMCERLRVEGQAVVLEKEVKLQEEAAEEHRLRLQELETEREALHEEVEKLKMEGHSALKQLMALLGIKDLTQITMEMRMQFTNSTLEETEKLLAEKDAHLACIVTATPTELMEYQERQKEIEKLSRHLDEAERKFNNHQTNLVDMKERWLPRIKELVKNISDQFSHFMSRLGCAGEVVLKEDGENFVNYGMVIYVKFRDHQKLQELTPHQQSGGERAVSTALYLLALQSLTAAPFRCVDEINQGMDPVNERLFLKMLMETEGNEDSSQYFFVTPKMMQDIEYKSRVNVLVVLSSVTNLPHCKHNIKRILKRRAEVNRQRGKKGGKGEVGGRGGKA